MKDAVRYIVESFSTDQMLLTTIQVEEQTISVQWTRGSDILFIQNDSFGIVQIPASTKGVLAAVLNLLGED